MCYCFTVSFKYTSKKGKENFGFRSCLGEPDLGMEVDDDFISEQVSVCFVLYKCYYAMHCTKLPPFPTYSVYI